MATGIQDKFSFKGVAIAAIAGGIGGALGPGGLFGEGAFSGVTSNKVLEGALRGATSSVLTQGIAVATGLQDKFSWTGVAVGAVVGGTIGGLEGPLGKAGIGKVGVKVIAGMAGAIAGAATRSLITGTDFGDNIIAALPEVIANTIGNLAANAIAGNGRSGATGAGDAKADQPTTNDGTQGSSNGSGSGSTDAQPGDIVVTARRSANQSYLSTNWWQFNTGQSQSAIFVNKVGGFEVTNTLAPSLSESATGYLEGLEVIGKSLTGTVLVEFSNIERLNIDKGRIISSMSLINQRTPDGYSINLNIVEDTLLNRIMHPFSPTVTVRPVANMNATYAPGAGAAYVESAFGNVILMEPDAPRHWILHEFGHNLGISHSGFETSVMFPASAKTATGNIFLKNGEVRNLVNAYRNATK